MHKKQNHIYVGLDLHKGTHTAVIIDCWEEKLFSITIENKPSDFTRLMNKVNKIAGNLIPVYGLEDVHGYGRSLAEFLRKPSHNSCSTRKAKEILDIVESDGDTTREYQESRDFIIQSIVRDIAFKSEEIKKVEVEMKKLLKLLDLKLETIPGIDTVTAIALVAHIGDIKRFRNADKLAKFSGIAPVNFSSAGKGKDKKSKQGNRELYGVFYFLAVQQVQVSKKGTPRNPVFLEYYKRKISEGKTKIQALVCVMRRLNNIIYGMMKNKTEYILPDMEVEQIA